MPPMIDATGVVKRFGKTHALDGLDLSAESGQVVALLGPNGAGKTTFVRLVATLIRPDAGELRVSGYDVVREPQVLRRMIGLAGQYAAIEPAMTGRENLELVARLFGQRRRVARISAAAVLERLGLSEVGDQLVRNYSGGMRRKLDLGASLVGEPRLLVLDEPTTGLDPRSRIELWDAIRALVAQGTDILLTTQYLEEADHLASHVVIIDHGRVVAAGTPVELKRRVGGKVIEVLAREEHGLGRITELLGRIDHEELRVDRATRRLSMTLDDGQTSFAATIQAIEALGVEIEELAVRQPKLDEVFLALTGRGAPNELEPSAS